jgi:hypothetical protein
VQLAFHLGMDVSAKNPLGAYCGDGAPCRAFGSATCYPSQSAIIGWISCVAEAAKRLAQGPDPAELVIKAALLACPDEKTNAIAEYQKKPHDNTLSPSMTESERNEAGLSRNFAFIKQMDQIATQSATSAIAEARSGSRH